MKRLVLGFMIAAMSAGWFALGAKTAPADDCCAGLAMAKCIGRDPCPACKTCEQCKHCNQDVGTCGTCKPAPKG
ncbi:MAG TPA: hypothetical protein VG406_23675 [Isosphaeraceae bacterium]|jgi:hypothetical protein|nr:hypothetical protein [Isosphaeraceae bacterium]